MEHWAGERCMHARSAGVRGLLVAGAVLCRGKPELPRASAGGTSVERWSLLRVRGEEERRIFAGVTVSLKFCSLKYFVV